MQTIQVNQSPRPQTSPPTNTRTTSRTCPQILRDLFAIFGNPRRQTSLILNTNRERQKYVLSNILSRTIDTAEDPWASNSLPIFAPQLPYYVITFLGNFYTTILTRYIYFTFPLTESLVLLKGPLYFLVSPRQSNVDLRTTESIVSSLQTVRAQFVKDLPPITEIL